MTTFHPNKKIKIEIRQCINPAFDYEVWDIRDKDRSRCIDRNASEQSIANILTDSQYTEFKSGKGIILVNAVKLLNQFSYMY
jgi:hypothetical protein